MVVDENSGFARVSGARLHYEVRGGEVGVATEGLGPDATPTSGETLVLIHAGIADGRMWDR